MSRSELSADMFAAAAGSAIHLLRLQPAGGPPAGSGGATFGQVVVGHAAPVCSTRWNRNNKVVASGCADGQIQLLYSAGQVMAVLPRDGRTSPASMGTVTSLSWSMGSKRLAAGSDHGTVFIFEMGPSSAQVPPVQLGGHLGGITALEYQHEDKFLAVASGGGSLVLYSDPHRVGAGGAASAAVPLRATPDTSARLCLSLAAIGETSLAAGSAAGGVAVWDVPTQRLREEYAGQHGGAAVNAVTFVPLQPSMLYSAGADGRVCLQDRQAGPGHVSAFSVGAPATALMVKEDHSLLGVGTTDGVVQLYDPRHVRQPLHTIQLEGGQPVMGLHWQHRYASLPGSRHRSTAAAAAPASARGSHQPAPPSRLGISAAPPAAGAAAVPSSVGAAAPSIGSRIAPVPASAGPPAAPTAQPAGSVSAPGSRATSPTGAAAMAAAPPAQPRSASLHAQSYQPPTAAAASNGAALPQVTPLHRAAAASALAVTPLPGMAPQYGGAEAAADVTPQQQVRGAGASADASQRMQQLNITPLDRGTLAAAGAAQRQQQPEQQQPLSPLERVAVAPVDFGITPLVAAPPARHPTAAAAAAGTAPRPFAPPPPLNITPLGDAGAGSRAQLCISPLPGMEASPVSASASPRQRSVLGERTNSGQSSVAPGRHGLLPQLSSPLPAEPEAERPPAVHASPSFVENLPLPLPSPGPARHRLQQPPQHGSGSGTCNGASLADHKIKSAAAEMASAEVELSLVASGALGCQWSISAAAGASPAADQAMPDAAPQQPSGSQPGGSSPLEFSFAAAQCSREQLSSGGAWGGAAAAAAEGRASTAGLPPGLRDDILALHFDMLNQFQAQQACMGQLVSQVLERNEALGAEVAALRKQLATLTGRRNEFLWL